MEIAKNLHFIGICYLFFNGTQYLKQHIICEHMALGDREMR